MSIRLLLLLASTEKPLSADRLVSLDYITTYAEDFGLNETNLNGYGCYRSAEFASRRQLINEAILELVKKGLLNITLQDNIYLYQVNELGMNTALSIEGSYADSYWEIARIVAAQFENLSDEELIEKINKKILKEK